MLLGHRIWGAASGHAAILPRGAVHPWLLVLFAGRWNSLHVTLGNSLFPGFRILRRQVGAFTPQIMPNSVQFKTCSKRITCLFQAWRLQQRSCGWRFPCAGHASFIFLLFVCCVVLIRVQASLLRRASQSSSSRPHGLPSRSARFSSSSYLLPSVSQRRRHRDARAPTPSHAPVRPPVRVSARG